ncbi:hypothetical protein O0I10_012019 [Lichtheimia ornata]|uniref:Uncharacterized protein n=1 Tax=Lichtheimia ornata TaxID=688661 RepID=A0AAD7USH6_9FUNG|nr:uncharacterized protein O0I10_012019 [Lichtheimia ornata]KAJ8652348.1 hypothetical protein O0I10_012019 [Lichtheimia ornata]
MTRRESIAVVVLSLIDKKKHGVQIDPCTATNDLWMVSTTSNHDGSGGGSRFGMQAENEEGLISTGP